MFSKNKPKPTQAERQRIERIASLPCVVCDEPGPSQVHEPEQSLWFCAVALCAACHTGPGGWHDTRRRWLFRKMTELKAIDKTNRLLEGA